MGGQAAETKHRVNAGRGAFQCGTRSAELGTGESGIQAGRAWSCLAMKKKFQRWKGRRGLGDMSPSFKARTCPSTPKLGRWRGLGAGNRCKWLMDSLLPSRSGRSGPPSRQTGTDGVPTLAKCIPIVSRCRCRDWQTFRRWAPSLPLSRPRGLRLRRILFATSQVAQIPSGSSLPSRCGSGEGEAASAFGQFCIAGSVQGRWWHYPAIVFLV